MQTETTGKNGTGKRKGDAPMYVFPEEIRKAYEAIPIPQVFYQFIDEKVVPLLVSLC